MRVYLKKDFNKIIFKNILQLKVMMWKKFLI